MTEVEYTKFRPDTEANQNFNVMMIKWPENEPLFQMILVVVSFDKSQQEYAEGLLWKHGLKRSKPGLTVGMIGPNQTEFFWLTGPNIFYLENHSQGGTNVMYTNDAEKMKAAQAHEKTLLQVFYDEHNRWLETPEGKKEAEEYWANHPEIK